MNYMSAELVTYRYRVECLNGNCKRENPLFVQGGYRAEQRDDARAAGHAAVYGHGGRFSLRHELVGHWEQEGKDDA